MYTFCIHVSGLIIHLLIIFSLFSLLGGKKKRGYVLITISLPQLVVTMTPTGGGVGGGGSYWLCISCSWQEQRRCLGLLGLTPYNPSYLFVPKLYFSYVYDKTLSFFNHR